MGYKQAYLTRQNIFPMSFTITLNWIIDVLITGLAIAVVAYLLPNVRVKNYGHAVLVGLLIALVNTLIEWVLGLLGITVTVGSITLVGFLLSIVSILLVDKLWRGFHVRSTLWAAIFAILVVVVDFLLTKVTAALLG